jgi:hypothetical protein
MSHTKSEPIPIALNLDDGAPINPMFWYAKWETHGVLVPNSFVRDFADVCGRYGARGKFSVMPMPCCTGRIDEGLAHVPQAHLRAFLDIVRKRIAPRFDITPEILTHDRAYMIDRKRFAHEYEDRWFAREMHKVPEKTRYISLALKILKNVGLPATGVTSPWMTGNTREKEYAEAIGRAFLRVHRRKFSWYSLHVLAKEPRPRSTVSWRGRKLGITVVHVPWTTDDCFWGTIAARSARTARSIADGGADRLLTRDGRRGRIRDLVDAGAPVVICTHWQSMFSEGRAAGLRGMEKVFDRVGKVFGGGVRWVKCSDLARIALRKGL